EEGGGVEPTEGKPRRERVLHVGDRLPEDLEDVPPPPADLAVALEEERRETGLDVSGRAVRERQTVAALVVRALGRVLAAPFLVDQARRRVVKGPALGIPHTRLADRVRVEHPAVAEACESRVRPAREHGQCLVARRLRGGSPAGPRREAGGWLP